MSAMRVTPQVDTGKDRDHVHEEMNKIIQGTNKEIMRFFRVVHEPIMSIFLNSSIQTWITRQSVIDILEKEWQVGNNGWDTGWSQDYGVPPWAKERAVGMTLMGFANGGQSQSLLLLKSLRDARLVGTDIIDSDKDIKSMEQLNSMKKSDDPSEIVHIDAFTEERVHIAIGKTIQSSGGDIEKLIEKLSKGSTGPVTRKRNLFGFGNKETVSFSGGMPTKLFDPELIAGEIGVYSINKDHPDISKALGVVQNELKDTSSGSFQPAFS